MSLLAALALGLVIGLSLGALGGGGSILTVPALVYVLHESSTAATTASLVIVGVTALAGSIGHARAGRVRWKAGIIFGVLGIPASYLGTALNRTVNPHVLLLCFGALMIIAAAGMLLRTRSGSDQSVPAAALATTGGSDNPGRYPSSSGTSATTASRRGIDAAATTKMVLAALLVGFLTGFLGVGGGFVIVPALVMVLAFPDAHRGRYVAAHHRHQQCRRTHRPNRTGNLRLGRHPPVHRCGHPRLRGRQTGRRQGLRASTEHSVCGTVRRRRGLRHRPEPHRTQVSPHQQRGA